MSPRFKTVLNLTGSVGIDDFVCRQVINKSVELSLPAAGIVMGLSLRKTPTPPIKEGVLWVSVPIVPAVYIEREVRIEPPFSALRGLADA
jgi:hypothetical protein